MQDNAVCLNYEPKISVRDVRGEILEQVRAIILELLENPDMTKTEIGKRVGCSGQYVQMILYYKSFPKRAEYQLKLLKKFQKIKQYKRNENGTKV